MQLDVLDLIAPSAAFMSTSYLSASASSGSNPTITYLSPPDDEGNQQLVYMKGWLRDSLGKPLLNADGSYQGAPWDWMTATTYTDPITGRKSGWIRQRLTENFWTDPKSGKLTFGLGMRRLPRYVDVDDLDDMVNVTNYINRPETDYLIFGAGGSTITRNTDNAVRFTIRGPYSGAAILDGQGNVALPAGTDWFEDYEWGGHGTPTIYSTKEVVAHRVGYGRYMWQAFASDGKGGYNATPSAFSVQSIITALPAAGVKPVQGVF